MRAILLAGTSLLTLSATVAAASALPLSQTFNYTGTIVSYPVPTGGYYEITATGAQGGTVPYAVSSNATGGDGAQVGGEFLLTGGEELQIAVGGQGGSGPGFGKFGSAGGGGGSFVVGPSNSPLLIAGGGGGGGGASGADGASATSMSATNNGGSAGSGGSGGGPITGGGGGGGGGLKGNGDNGSAFSAYSGIYAHGGNAFANGAGGGAGGAGFPDDGGHGGAGGFGGGGGGGGAGVEGGGGGGGGYSGGGGGGEGVGGGAGGSFNAGAYQTFATATGGGNGSITIGYYGPPPDYLAPPNAVPEPASLALFGSGALGLLAMRRSRRR